MSFPSCFKSLFEIEAKWQAIVLETIFITMQIKVIFTTKVVHLASFWKREFLELGNALLNSRSIGLEHKHGHLDVMWKGSIGKR